MASPSAFLRVLVGVVVVAAGGGCDPGTPEAGATTSPATAGPPSPAVFGRERPVKITGPQAGLLTQEQIEAAVPGTSGPGVSFTEQVLPELQEKTLDMGGVPGKISTATCAGGKIKLAPMAGTWCTVVFRGLRVDWNVVIGSDYESGDRVVHYTVHPRKRILTAKLLYNHAWLYYREMSDEVRCDKLPEIWLADKGKSTGYSCQYLRTLSDTERRWVDEEIFVRDDGEFRFG
ncbi:hypothetical protein AAH979_29100 [Plantactinospora sp. ZYX-F-223]|uniref:hypothetical protein n=1 Tax=Plantactinospora sp. ZYX-F-223 TaxID=3144103 RepID=UPI0031FE31CA